MCCFALNILEVLNHLCVFKTKECEFQTLEGVCKKNSKYCRRAHNDFRKISFWNKTTLLRNTKRSLVCISRRRSKTLIHAEILISSVPIESSSISQNILIFQKTILKSELSHIRCQLSICEQTINR